MGAAQGEEESVLEFLDSGVSARVLPYLNEKTTFFDLVQDGGKEKRKSLDSDAFWIEYGQKLSPAEAMKPLYLWSMYGTYLGLKFPPAIMTLYETSYRVGSEGWDLAFKVGIVSTPEQQKLSAEGLSNEIRESFYEFCSQYYPELMSVLFQI